MKGLLLAAACLLAGCTNTLTPETQNVLAKTCVTGQTFYGYIVAAATTEAIPAKLKAQADQAYAILHDLCEKGSSATQTDIVLAGAQVYVLTKAWRDAT